VTVTKWPAFTVVALLSVVAESEETVGGGVVVVVAVRELVFDQVPIVVS
jgi:hypothetical protein